jgi:hypothetical protein
MLQHLGRASFEALAALGHLRMTEMRVNAERL